MPTVTWKKEKSNQEKAAEIAEAAQPVINSNPIPEKPTAKMLIDFGYVRSSMGQYPEAAGLFERAIKLEPRNVDARVGLAKVKMKLGHPDQAVAMLQEGLAKLPKAAPLWNEIGIAYAKQEQYPEAIEALEKAHKFDPSSELYRTNLAGVLVVMGEEHKAYKLYAQTMSEADARVQIARILGGMGKTESCRKQIDAAIRSDPTNKYAHQLADEFDPQFQQAGYSVPR